MQANVQAALDRILASEGLAIRFGPSELGGASFGGVTLGAYGEYCAAHGLTAPTLDDWKAIEPPAVPLTNAQLADFYAWNVFAPIRFSDLPAGVDYAVADWAVNSGVAGALSAIRSLFRVPATTAPWRMDGALFAVLADTEPAFAICAICDGRWAMMEAAQDFAEPSATTPGKIIGDGRAFRVSSAFRGAMEIIGHAPVADRYAVFR